MATYLLCSTPVHGHVQPMLSIGAHLRARGHRVVLLTGGRFRDQAERLGLEFRALQGSADFDDRDVESYLPDRARYPAGVRRAQYDIQTMFVRTIPDQLAAVRAVLWSTDVSTILVDCTFGGVLPLLAEDRGRRPPVLAVGVLPLAQSSRDVAPQGLGLPPVRGALGRLRNRALRLYGERVLFRRTQQLAGEIFRGLGVAPPGYFVMDSSRVFDRFLQLNTAAFEYPRSDLAPNTAFVGPVPPRPGSAAVPTWWADLDAGRPVVHVSQGTIDNRDLTRLVVPTLRALADDDVLVVVSTGGRPPVEVTDAWGAGPLPANVRVADYLPYDDLLPRVDVFLTNGGFGGVQQALSQGVPMVIAGDTEDKPEVAARVAHCGAGLDLRTGTPMPEALRAAVRRVLADPSYRAAALVQADAIAAVDALVNIEEELVIARLEPVGRG